jgi:hypothetical protein
LTRFRVDVTRKEHAIVNGSSTQNFSFPKKGTSNNIPADVNPQGFNTQIETDSPAKKINGNIN